MSRVEPEDPRFAAGFMQGFESCKRKLLMHLANEIDVLKRWNMEGKQEQYLRALMNIEQEIEDRYNLSDMP